MELGAKIKQLRLQKGTTQEDLANRLGVTYQTVSKWENNVTMPDIQLLPELSIYFGITIDELFELTREKRLERINNMLEDERVLTEEQFQGTLDFLKSELDKDRKDAKINTYLANLHLHRSLSEGEIAAEYARVAIKLNPEETSLDCHQVLMKTGNGVLYDWNAKNHRRTISDYYHLINVAPNNWHLYLFLMDNLLADYRLREAKEILKKYSQLQQKPEYKVMVYEAYISIAEGEFEKSEKKLDEMQLCYKENAKMWFDLADLMAKRCRYDEAIKYYEKAFELWEKPRYYDPLEAIAHIYEIQGKYEESARVWERIIIVIQEEFNIQSGEVLEAAKRELERLKKMQ